jgi:hypothetical protein
MFILMSIGERSGRNPTKIDKTSVRVSFSSEKNMQKQNILFGCISQLNLEGIDFK